MRIVKRLAAFLCVLMAASVYAQSSNIEQIKTFLERQEIESSSIEGLEITKTFTSTHNGVLHVYGKQFVHGIPIANSNFTAAFDKDGVLVHVAPRLVDLKGTELLSPTPAQDSQSILAASLMNEIPNLVITQTADGYLLSNGKGYQFESIPELKFYATPEAQIVLVWNFNVDMPSQEHWYDYFVDAQTGQVLAKKDWQLSCEHETHVSHTAACTDNHAAYEEEELMFSTEDGSSYRVFEFPIESPNHGERTLAVEPALDAASPFGWHDGDGLVGPDYANTRGNNVYAYEDAVDNNSPGFSPDGGSGLLFDFEYEIGDGPIAYQSASITNLFYANNRIHDLLFIYGFDEASGNFQSRNYTGLGEGFDPLNAEAQDGGGTNNANMATPPEGSSPRMQMYLWDGEAEVQDILNINDPSGISGPYTSSDISGFGAEIPEEGITADIVLAEDADGPDFNDLCTAATNASELAGKIAIVKRGNCNFTDKVISVMDAGALACIVMNNGPGFITMGGTSPEDISIPSIMISEANGQIILDAIANGETVNATLQPNALSTIRDGSFDNGIIAHEFVHGVSNRLTGGADETGCLGNEEQMGEGWSDWFATMLTMDMSADNPVYRPMGTFASGEPTTGNGIRPAPYDTSFAINDYTYANLTNPEVSIPHGVGFIWSTMLWDLSWAFIDAYGYEDLETGTTGGNNIVMQLVMDGLKLQVCSPGFVDGRDAILLADQLNNAGANQCLIWEVFAKRGLGFSADQGSSASVSDGTAAYDLPNICQEVFVAPTAGFEASAEQTCFGVVEFTDTSVDVPQSWMWDFGDGETSDEQNPTHQYMSQGVYTVSLTVTNTLGEDTQTQIDLVVYSTPEAPEVTDGIGCVGELITLEAESTDGDILWTDSDNNEVGIGESLEITLGSSDEIYYAQTLANASSPEFVGPTDGSQGSGGNHDSDFTGTVDFEVFEPAVIVSVWVNSGGVGTRVINLWEGASGSGDLVAQYPVDIDFTGGDRIDLNIEILNPGIYSIGLNQANFFRNDGGVSYPYTGDLLDIIGSSAGSDYYYYFYDFEVKSPNCVSEPVEVLAEISGDAIFSFDLSGLTVSFTDLSQNANSWTWDFGDGENSSDQNPTHTYESSGVYTVTLTTDQGCSFSTEVEVIVSGIPSVLNSGIAISPNPANDYMTITNPKGQAGIAFARILDMEGRTVALQNLNQSLENELPVSDLANGIYMLILEDRNSKPLFQEKISIVH